MDMVWFLEQEAVGEAGLDDLVALAQVRLPKRAKLELARSYWDEMGQGHASSMHGPMLARLSEALGLAPNPSHIAWESWRLEISWPPSARTGVTRTKPLVPSA